MTESKQYSISKKLNIEITSLIGIENI